MSVPPWLVLCGVPLTSCPSLWWSEMLACDMTLVLRSLGGLFFWGATNTSRESTMYPKAVQDLCGWRIRSLACG